MTQTQVPLSTLAVSGQLHIQHVAHLNRARALVGLLPTKDLLDTSGLDESFVA
jgi:hypothetical protein